MSQVAASPAGSFLSHHDTSRISPVSEPEWLIEARLAYPNERPSFVARSQYRSRNKPVLLADETGKLPEHPVHAELIPRDWDNKDAFWTLRKGDETYIVKPFAGGWSYKVFLGEREQFADVAIAYPARGYHTASKQRKSPTSVKTKLGARDSFLRDELPSDDDDDGGNDNDNDDFEPAFGVQDSNGIHKTHDKHNTSNLLSLEPIMVDSPRDSEDMTSHGDYYNPVQHEEASHDQSPINERMKNSLRRQSRPNYNIAAAFNAAINTSPIAARGTCKLDRNQSSHSEPQNTSKTATGPKKRKRVSIEAQDTANTPKIVQSNEAHQLTALIVDEYKQRNTTLRVAIPHSPFVPIKLRSCMTLQRLFDCVLEASGQTARGNAVSGLGVTFDWKQLDDPCRNMIVRRFGDAGKDSFETFLETVLEAPCWVETAGKCAVSVSPTLA